MKSRAHGYGLRFKAGGKANRSFRYPEHNIWASSHPHPAQAYFINDSTEIQPDFIHRQSATRFGNGTQID